jgi:hypothetical protein
VRRCKRHAIQGIPVPVEIQAEMRSGWTRQKWLSGACRNLCYRTAMRCQTSGNT